MLITPCAHAGRPTVGKSFLLTTVYLFCILERIKCKAAAPTGIAAANIELEGTKINACTMHAMFSIGGDAYESKLDFTRSDEKVQELVNSRVLLFDEVSMLDNEIWDVVTKLLGLAHQRRTGGVAGQGADEYGSVHLICFGDFKQLPYPVRVAKLIKIAVLV